MKRLPIAALLLLGACATDTPAPTPGPASVITAPAPVGAAVGQSVETTSIVESVDQKTRQVLLRLEDGTYMTLKVPASVRGLGQVKAGDRVVARVTRAIAVDIAKADGSAPIEAGEIETQAPKGLPAGALLRAVRSHVEATAEHVGPRFAEEARRMHDGVVEFRAIYGEATAEEALALAEEGIDIMPLPQLPDERN